MAEPKKKSSKTRTGWRRSRRQKKIGSLTLCPKCKQPVLPHRVCPNCGTYRNRQVIKLKENK